MLLLLVPCILADTYWVPNTHCRKLRIAWQSTMHTEVKERTRHRFATTATNKTLTETESISLGVQDWISVKNKGAVPASRPRYITWSTHEYHMVIAHNFGGGERRCRRTTTAVPEMGHFPFRASDLPFSCCSSLATPWICLCTFLFILFCNALHFLWIKKKKKKKFFIFFCEIDQTLGVFSPPYSVCVLWPTHKPTSSFAAV